MTNKYDESEILEVLLRIEERFAKLEEDFEKVQVNNEAVLNNISHRNDFAITDVVANINQSEYVQNIFTKLEHVDRTLEKIFDFTVSQVNARSLTLEWLANNTHLEVKYLLELISDDHCKNETQDDEVFQMLSAYPYYNLVCTKNIATDSHDNNEPESTFEGAVSRPLFVLACERIINKDKLSFLDVGCGSGAIVFDFIKRGHFAVGLDGSDACKISNKGYWKYIKHLHTCDVSKKFEFLGEINEKLNFDVVSMWEVFEHIPEKLCPDVLKNIYSNLANDGLFVGSISRLEYISATTGIPYHVTIKDYEWWKCMFSENGFEFVKSEFKNGEYCRGVGNVYQDPHNYEMNPETGFHFTARKIIGFKWG